MTTSGTTAFREVRRSLFEASAQIQRAASGECGQDALAATAVRLEQLADRIGAHPRGNGGDR